MPVAAGLKTEGVGESRCLKRGRNRVRGRFRWGPSRRREHRWMPAQLGTRTDPARHQHSVRQHALQSRQPQRAVGPRADAEPAQFHRKQRHAAHQPPHPAHLPHRDRHPDVVHRRLRRQHGCAGLEQLPLLQPGRHDQHGRFVRVLDRSDLRPGHVHPDRPQLQHAHRGRQERSSAMGAVHAGGLQRRPGGHGQHGAREHRHRHPDSLRHRLAAGGRGGLQPGPGICRLRRYRCPLRAGELTLLDRQRRRA